MLSKLNISDRIALAQAALVVSLSERRIAQDLVGLTDLEESTKRIVVSWIPIWMMLLRHLDVRVLHLLGRGSIADAKHVIMVRSFAIITVIGIVSF